MHDFQFAKNKERRRKGGTRSLGFTRGSIVRHLHPSKTLLKNNDKAIFLIGGFDEKSKKLTLISIYPSGKDGDRVSRSINPKDIKLLAYNRFQMYNK